MTALRFFSGIALLLCASIAPAQEWTRFRGPNGGGISLATGIPPTFTEAETNWKVALPGIGHSQPVLWGEKIFVTSAPLDGDSRVLSCLSARDGRALWEKRWTARGYRTNRRNSFASSSPAVEADRVYIALANPGELFVVALDHSGNQVWRSSLGAYHSQHGFGASPIIFENMLVMPKEHLRRDGDPEMTSALYALDSESGNLLWKTPRRSRRAAYGTPCVYEGEKGRPELLFTSGANGIYSVEARTGKPLWDADVFDKRTVSSPVVGSGIVFGTCGSGGGGNYLVAVRPGGKGDVKNTHQLYRLRQSIPYVPTPVAKGNRIYLWSDRGIATCAKASTGEIVWRERIQGGYSGSPVWVDGRLYCISDEGEAVVIAAEDEFRLLGRSPLGEPSRSTPAVAGGRMYLRTYSHLISVGGKKVATR